MEKKNKDLPYPIPRPNHSHHWPTHQATELSGKCWILFNPRAPQQLRSGGFPPSFNEGFPLDVSCVTPGGLTEVSKLWYPLHINQRRQLGYLGITCGFLQVFGRTVFFGGGEEFWKYILDTDDTLGNKFWTLKCLKIRKFIMVMCFVRKNLGWFTLKQKSFVWKSPPNFKRWHIYWELVILQYGPNMAINLISGVILLEARIEAMFPLNGRKTLHNNEKTQRF